MTKVGCKARSCGYNNNEECNKMNKIDVEGLYAKSRIGTFCQSFKNPLDSDILKAEIVDMSKSQMVIQICDLPEKIQLFMSMMKSVSIVEVARTGTLALPKCSDSD